MLIAITQCNTYSTFLNTKVNEIEVYRSIDKLSDKQLKFLSLFKVVPKHTN